MTPISAILEEIAEWDPALRACIRRFPRALNWTILEDGVEPRWVSNGGKIGFAGDSVHPLSPASFHAGAQAVEDGATVALCLALAGGTPDKIPLAFKVYERLRKDRTQHAGKLGRKQQRILHTFVGRKRESTQLLDPTSVSELGILRPLAFELFDFDAEQYAVDHFAETVEILRREAREE
ncbi:hypothetical protein JCM3766R1_004391 [Sporobolomyces carnicolor]